MTEPLADRLLDALGDPITRNALRALLERDRAQGELIDELAVAQATVSRALKVLRAVGLVAPVEGGRGPRLGVTVPQQATALLLAADRLAEQVLELERQAQEERSHATRRSAIKPTAAQVEAPDHTS